MKVVLLLLLVLKTECQGDVRCSQQVPPICMNNRYINISQERSHYRLKLCSSNGCILGNTSWIKCNEMCSACRSILPPTECSRNQSQCEEKVVSFLSNYCENLSSTPSTHTRTVTVTKNIFHTPVIHYRTKSQTVSVCTSTAPYQDTQTNQLFSVTGKQASERNESALAVLGVFLGLLVIVLLVVSTGFMWTVWTLKKERSEKAR